MATCRQCGQPTSIFLKDIFTGMCSSCHAGVTTAKLGCGTLIMIVIIVAIFSSQDYEDLESDIIDLELVVQELKQSVDSQTNDIHEMHSKIDKLKELQENRSEKPAD